MSEAIEAGRRRMFGGGPHNQYVAAALAPAPPSTEDAFSVLPGDLEAAIPISVKSRGTVQLPDPSQSRWLIVRPKSTPHDPIPMQHLGEQGSVN